MAEQLWSDERILQEVSRQSVRPIGGIGVEPDNLKRWFIDSGVAHNIARQVRDDLQAALDAANQRIAELEKELAEANDRLSNYDAVWLYYAGLVEGDEPVDFHELHTMYEKGRADERELCRRKEAGE